MLDNLTMNKMNLSVLLWPLLLLPIIGCSGTLADQKTEYIPEVSVIEINRNGRQTFQVTGEVLPRREATYIAEAQSRVEKIYVKPGQKVTEGQLLVSLDAPSLKQRYATAANAYNTAALNYQQTKFNSVKRIQAAQETLKTAETNLAETIRKDEEKRKQAEEILRKATLNTELGIDAAQTGYEGQASQSYPVMESAITAMETILEGGIFQTELDRVRENHIGVRDPAYKTFTMLELGKLRQGFTAGLAVQNNALNLLAETERLLIKALKIMRDSITSSAYTTADLNTEIGQLNNQLTAVRVQITALKSAKDALDRAKMSAEGGESQTIIEAEAAYNSALADLDAALAQAKRQVEEAKAALQSAETNARISELGAQSTTTSVAGELMQAKIEQDKLRVRASFSGYVSDVPVLEGNTVKVGQEIVGIEDHETLKIVAYLSPHEAKRIKAGDKVKIAAKSEDVISAVAPSADSLTKKYKVEIMHQNPYIKPGEFVSLTFSASEQAVTDDRILIPLTSVHIKGTETFVWGIEEKQESTAVIKKTITIGEIDGAYVQVVSGLTDGDMVVTEGGRIIETEGTLVKVNGAGTNNSEKV